MKKQTAIALLFLLGLSFPLLAQVNRCSYVIPRHTDNWLFAQNAGLLFDASGDVSANNPSGNNLSFGINFATFSDESGNLLFYTNGRSVYNSNNVQINYGPLLSGSYASSTSIVPNPSSPNQFYIFTTSDIVNNSANDSTSGLNFSMVDMSQGSGGAVVQHNRHLLDRCIYGVSAVEASDKSGFWVVTRGLENNSFYSFKVTSEGVDTNAVISPNLGSVISSDPNLQEGIGILKISPDGKRIAYSSFGGQFVELFNFDSSTGEVSGPAIKIVPPQHFVTPYIGPYSIEFSPDGSKLFVIVIFFNDQSNNRIYQYDINLSMKETWLNDSPMAQNPTALQLARDGKIYVSRAGSAHIGVIGAPNRPDISCNYTEDWILVPGAPGVLKRNAFPTFVQSYFNNPHFDYDTKCDGDATEFWLHNPSFSDATTTWDFGDAGNTTQGTGLNPAHQFSGPGVFNVSVTERWNGESFTTTLPVIINALPPKSFAAKGDSMYLFPGSRIPLDGGQGMFSYFWQDGSNNQFFDVDSPGLVVVEYEDMNCCRNSDSLKVIALDISLPNAFTPDGNGVNDYFKALGPSDGIEDFTLAIYNRWGQRIWETKNFADSWDGTLSGQQLPSGVYTWYLTFNVIGNISSIGKVKYKGSVTLLR
ncbi:MAG: PKD domain-containing [Bacteroidetes bacterium]|nr:MAG: PKD domain-containing [Bacteroidota bacterium]